ncbi:ImmA/IrrE family metallo-endopeptidase [Massilia cellulosiltytica]|uniref:ImmA/IrrE family metallo-endopeptidase n=1 Tax=Massilia cellulosiltytica TaxID=2683234 RepID=UPI0039B490F7
MSFNREIEKKALALLEQCSQTQPAIDVESISRQTGVNLHREQLDDQVSGMLVVKAKAKHIIINKLHHPNRQRFTIAHELGHLMLHHKAGDKVFLDTSMSVYKRAGVPGASTYSRPDSTTTPEQEREANLFAASLLMPRDVLLNYIEEQDIDLDDEFDISRLASVFEVSEQAMYIRLSYLELIQSAY